MYHLNEQESVTIYDGEAPVLKNLPAQDLNVTVHECVAPSANLVISADNDPSFEGGIVVPTDEVLAVSGVPRRSTRCSVFQARLSTIRHLVGVKAHRS